MNMKRMWVKVIFWVTPVLLLLCIQVGTKTAQAQQGTPDGSDVIVTVIYNDQINVRNGPNTVLYDIIGHLQPGDTAMALGVSPGRDWVKIEFPSAPEGVGWVHISLIAVSPGNLQIIEPPPTATPLTTPTIDPTLAAAYVYEPTAQHLPTFTAAPALNIPQFAETPSTAASSGFPLGALVFGLGIPGLIGFLITVMRRR